MHTNEKCILIALFRKFIIVRVICVVKVRRRLVNVNKRVFLFDKVITLKILMKILY